MQKIAGKRGAKCRFVQLAPVNSAIVHLVQAADLLTGATHFAWENKSDASSKKTTREALTHQIESWAGGPLTKGFHSSRHYSLWIWKPRTTRTNAA
jgi:hypothetical protein